MGWYIVIKTIKGRQYRYRQRTWREGNRVRTESHSLGPVSGSGGKGTHAVKTGEDSTGILRKHVIETFSELQSALPPDASWRVPWDSKRIMGPRIPPVAAFETVIRGCAPKLQRSRRGAFYRPVSDDVILPPQGCFVGATPEERASVYYSTVLHELAHWTGHQNRCNRFARAGNLHLDPNRAREELVAEATAVIVMKALGHPPADLRRHIIYFQDWLGLTENREEAIAYTMREAEMAADYILRTGGVNTTSGDVIE